MNVSGTLKAIFRRISDFKEATLYSPRFSTEQVNDPSISSASVVLHHGASSQKNTKKEMTYASLSTDNVWLPRAAHCRSMRSITLMEDTWQFHIWFRATPTDFSVWQADPRRAGWFYCRWNELANCRGSRTCPKTRENGSRCISSCRSLLGQQRTKSTVFT